MTDKTKGKPQAAEKSGSRAGIFALGVLLAVTVLVGYL